MPEIPSSRSELLDKVVDVALTALTLGLSAEDLAFYRAVQVPQQIISYLSGEREDDRAVGCQFLTMALRSSLGDLVGAARLSMGVSKHLLAHENHGIVFTKMLSNVLTVACSTALDSGQSDAVLEVSGEWSKLLAGLGEDQAAKDLLLKRAEAFINKGDYQAAERVILEEGGDLPEWLDPIRERLHGKTGILCRPDENVRQADPRSIVEKTRKWLTENDANSPILPHLSAETGELLSPEVLLASYPAPPPALDPLVKAAEELSESRTPFFALSAVLEACPVHLAEGQSPSVYEAIASVASLASSAAARLDHWEHGTTARWIQAIAFCRLKAWREALDHLLKLSQRIEQCRSRITNPLLRAGVAVYLPHLSWVTADTALKAGDNVAALYSVESSKARILGELKEVGGGVPSQPDPQLFLQETVARLRQCSVSAHLLSYLVDTDERVKQGDEGVIAILLLADGTVHAARIPLYFKGIAYQLKLIQRRIRGGFPTRKLDPEHPEQVPFTDVIGELSPLTLWIDDLFHTGEIKQDDLLVISPDGPIHNVPLAMLPLGIGCVIDHLSLITVPSAALLLSATWVVRPTRAIAVLKPEPSEIHRGQHYQWEAAALRSLLPTQLAVEDSLREVLLDSGTPLLYLAMHGEADQASPIKSKGLGSAGGSSWFTPEEIRRLPLHGVHVDLRACMSGIVTQLTSREALGVVWAVLIAGAPSLVSAAWSVDIFSAREFFDRFHTAWIKDGVTRAEAHRRACLALRNAQGAWSHPYHWAPFVLTVSTLEGDIA